MRVIQCWWKIEHSAKVDYPENCTRIFQFMINVSVLWGLNINEIGGIPLEIIWFRYEKIWAR